MAHPEDTAEARRMDRENREDTISSPRTKTVMIPMGEHPNWVDLGPAPMVLCAVKGDCVFATGAEQPDYSEDGGLPLSALTPTFIYSDVNVWARLAPDIQEGEVIVGPL